ncbi:MAG: tetratricopeptide repeat protein, partial [Chloroflexota bacterium]
RALADSCLKVGLIAQGITHLEQSVEIAHRLGYRDLEGTWLGDLGGTYLSAGDQERAKQTLQEAIAILKECSNVEFGTIWYYRIWLLKAKLPILSRFARRTDPDNTLTQVKLNLHQGIDRIWERFYMYSPSNDLPFTRFGYANDSVTKWVLKRCLFDLRLFLSPIKSILPKRSEEMARGVKGYIHHLLGEDDQAIDQLQQALDLNQQTGSEDRQALWLTCLGLIYYCQDDLDQALEFLQRSETIATKMFDPWAECKRARTFANIYHKQKEYDKAIEYFEQALEVIQSLDDQETEIFVLEDLISVYKALGQAAKVIELRKLGLQIAQNLNRQYFQQYFLSDLGHIHIQLNQFEQAKLYLHQALNDFDNNKTDLDLAEVIQSNLSLVEDKLNK